MRPIKPVGRAADSVFEMFEGEVDAMIKSGKRVYLVLSNPNSWANNPRAMLPRRIPWLPERQILQSIDRREMDARAANVRTRLRGIAQRTGAIVIDPMLYLCGGSRCPTVSAHGIRIYTDDHHLRPNFVRDFATFIDPVVAR